LNRIIADKTSKTTKANHTAYGAYEPVPTNDCKKENHAISEITEKKTKKEKPVNVTYCVGGMNRYGQHMTRYANKRYHAIKQNTKQQNTTSYRLRSA